jgi:hypothetical protein
MPNKAEKGRSQGITLDLAAVLRRLLCITVMMFLDTDAVTQGGLPLFYLDKKGRIHPT